MANKTYSVVTGDVNGRFSEVFAKLAKLHTKQSFAFAILAGDAFASPEAATPDSDADLQRLLDGAIEVALPTYFSLGTRTLPATVLERLQSSGGELCPNLTALGRRVSIKTTEGFRIVAVGGSHANDDDAATSPYDATYSDADIQSLVKDFSEADILVTSDWPTGITTGSKTAYPSQKPREVQGIADLCTAVTPRYHFSASSSFFEREPFFHVGPSPRKITRFISLAPFGNADKQKWIYAFSLEPLAPPPVHLDPGFTASPFRNNKKRKLEYEQGSGQNFRYANTNGQSYQHDRDGRKKHKSRPDPTPGECFFCLSNEACATHMITSIGTDCYVAVAKGPLSTRSTFSDLGFPCHMLLIPLQHAPTIGSIPEEEARRSTVLELQKYRTAMHDMLKAKTQDESGRSKLGAVTWEVSRNRGVHVHWQLLPVPVDMIQKGLVEVAFDVEAENLNYPKFAKTAAAMAEAEEGDYIKVMIWSEALRKEMVLPIDGSFRFDLQFGRKVLAKLLGLDNRFDWRACSQDRVEEEADAMKFKEAFKTFDFSLEDE